MLCLQCWFFDYLRYAVRSRWTRVTRFDSTRLSSPICNLSSGLYSYCHTGVIFRKLIFYFTSFDHTSHHSQFWGWTLRCVSDQIIMQLTVTSLHLVVSTVFYIMMASQSVLLWTSMLYSGGQRATDGHNSCPLCLSASRHHFWSKLNCVHLLTFLHTYVLTCTCVYIYPLLSNGVEVLQTTCNILQFLSWIWHHVLYTHCSDLSLSPYTFLLLRLLDLFSVPFIFCCLDCV
jgi:hypothetical protein